MAKDSLGNPVEVGDLVQVKLDSPIVYGHIKSISEGGISLLSGRKDGRQVEAMTPGNIVIALELGAQFDPRDQKAPGLVRVYEPKEEGERKSGILAN